MTSPAECAPAFSETIVAAPRGEGMSKRKRKRSANPLVVLLFVAIVVVWLILVIIGLVLYFLIKTGAIADLG